MKEIKFNQENFGTFGGKVAWTNEKCPYCDYFHSQNFVFKPEKDKTEYIKRCMKCGKKVKIKAEKEVINLMVKAKEREAEENREPRTKQLTL